MSPSIGSPQAGDAAIDLDEVDTFLAPSNAYWLHTCACMREPRVKQFCRPKFIGIVAALVLTALFLAATVTIATIPHDADAGASEASNSPATIASMVYSSSSSSTGVGMNGTST